MSNDSQPSGFLSKMVKFVRHPATSWGDLDTMAGGRDTGYSQQALKEMIERKRRNDFVRKREFDMLRKLRSKARPPDAGYGGRPSFFQSSFSSKPDDRVGTLKKIDEIEAQMSQQWWRTRSRTQTEGPTTLPPDASVNADTGNRRQHADNRRAYLATLPQNSATTLAMTEPMSQPGGEFGARSQNSPMTSQMPPLLEDELAALARDGGPTAASTSHAMVTGDSGFSSSQFYALDVQELAMDPEIEEASIRFASGDDAATEQGLRDTLMGKGVDATPDEWMALFDFYRATAQVEVFEQRAMDFANLFSRSAPQWVSLPEEAARRLAAFAEPAGALARSTWQADAELDAHAVMLLSRLLQRVPQPWLLDWSPLASVHPLAVPRLLQLFSEWGNACDVDVRFLGASTLQAVLQRMTPSGDATVDQAHWQLRLAMLRVMNLGDEFEMTALDFCVTYELSPPSWESPLCSFTSVEPTLGGSASGETVLMELPDAHAPTTPTSDVDMLQTGTFAFRSAPQGELVGELLGDPANALAALDAQVQTAPVFVVSCRYLIRVDFSAAGSILNWVSAYQAKGQEIQFVDVHRLIAAFFHVIGITQYAKVQTCDD